MGKEQSRMRFSFIIPVYNTSAVEKCVVSLRKGSLADDEILLIDDGSEKSTADLCDRIAGRDSRIRVFHQKNQGVSAARNRGILEAKGDLIMFADADDRVDPQVIGHAAAVFSRQIPPDLLFFEHRAVFYQGSVPVRQEIHSLPARGMLTVTELAFGFLDFFTSNALSPIWNKVFRRDILVEAGLLLNTSMTVYEDFEFTLRYLAHCRNIYCLNEIGYDYRVEERQDNTGRRMRKIPEIGDVLLPLSRALDEMESSLTEMDCQTCREQKDQVLQKLFLILAREKLSVTRYRQMKDQCSKMRGVLRKTGISGSETLTAGEALLVSRIEKDKILQIYLERKYSRLRHRAAVFARGTGIRTRGKRRASGKPCKGTERRNHNKDEN